MLSCRTLPSHLPKNSQVIPETDRHPGFQDITTPSQDRAMNAGMSRTFIPLWHTTHAPLSHCGSSLHHHASPAHINSHAPWVPTTTPRPPSCPKNDTGRRDVAPHPPPCSHLTELSADNCSDRAKTSRRVWASSSSVGAHACPATLILSGSIWVQTVFI